MRSLPLLLDMATNLVRLHEELPVECTEDATDEDGFQPQRALVERAIRGAMTIWKDQFPPMPESVEYVEHTEQIYNREAHCCIFCIGLLQV
jgi:hypothetical protein